MGKDTLAKRIAEAEAGQDAGTKKKAKKEDRRESVLKKAVTKIKKAVTEEHRRKGFI